MAQVNVDDDTIWRWVIYHHRFDPDRNEHRPVVVSGYDNAREFERELERYSRKVREEIEAGVRSEREWVSGSPLHPGHRAEQARAHMVRRAMEHGVDPRPLLQQGPLPSNIAIYGTDEHGAPFSHGGGARRDARREAGRLIVRMFGLYSAIVVVVGLVVGLLTQSVLLGLIGVVVAVCVLPFIATGLRVRHQRKRSTAAR